MKEKISNTRLNRLALEEMLDDEQDRNDRDLFKKIDVEDNGFITYQDIQHMSEVMTSHQPFEFMQFEDDGDSVTHLVVGWLHGAQ